MGGLRIVAASTLAAVALAGASIPGQIPAPAGQSPPGKGVVRKGKAPISEETLRVKLPRPQEADLPNGLHLMVLEDHRTPQITFTLLVPGAGGYHDPADLAGLASFTAALMREGTVGRTSAQISEQLETLAAALNVGTGMSSTEASLSGSLLTEHVDRLLDLAADVLLNPTFPDQELARYKQRTRAQLVQQRASPNFLASEMFARVIYGSHPGGRVSPTLDALDRVTRAALVDFHKSRYVPDGAVLAMAGDVSMANARRLIEARLGAWKRAGAPAPPVADPPPLGPSHVSLVARPNSVQTNVVVGTQAIRRTDSDYDVLSVMNKVIGGGPTGRLFITLREDKGYTYGAYSGLAAGHFRGAWQAFTDVRAEVTAPALADLMAEIARLRDERVPEQEFREARRSMVAAFALSLESPQEILGYFITRWQHKLPADYWDSYPDRVMAVTQEQVQAAAAEYLDPRRLRIVAVGDAGKVADILRTHGELVTDDADGRRIGPTPD